MKKLISSCIFLLAIVFLATAQTYPDYLPNRVIFKIRPEHRNAISDRKVHDENLKYLFEEYRVSAYYQKFIGSKAPETEFDKYKRKMIDISTIYEAELNADIFAFIGKLEKLEIVEYAQPHYLPQLLYIPDDPYNTTNQFHLAKIMAYEAWDISKGDSSIVIGITDTGTDIDHPDLIYQIAYNTNDPVDGADNDGDGFIDNFRGWDLAEYDNNPQADSSPHGTWITGLSSAETDNGIGVAGVGFKCKYLPVKISDNENQLTMAYEGIVYAADHGCKVINCSWGGSHRDALGQDVVDYAVINRDVLVIAACGNTNNQIDYYPASFDRVLSVAATTWKDEKWSPLNTQTTSGSSYSYRVDISAPGAMLYSTDNGGYLTCWGGTSFASPVVAGAAGVLRSYYPHLSALQIGELLKISSDNIDTVAFNEPFAGMLGAGRINMFNAITDEFTPSIIMEDIVVEDDRENNYENSTLVKVKGNVINYLADAENVVVQVSCSSLFVTLLTTQISIGDLAAMEHYSLDEHSIQLNMAASTPVNTPVLLKLQFTADNYITVQNIEITLNPGCKNLNVNDISLPVAANGRFGYYDVARKFGDGMDYREFDDLFNDCGLIAGTALNTVFCSVRQQSDFLPVTSPVYVNPPESGDMQISCSMNESNDINSLGITINQNVYAWMAEEYKNLVIIDYKFINTTTIPVTGLYAGIFADWDLVNPYENIASYDFQDKFIFTQHTGANTLYCAMKLLSPQNENHYCLELVSGGDGLVDLTDGMSDSERFYIISNSRDEMLTDSNGEDAANVVSAGPVNIAPADTATMVFAMFAAENYFDLKQTAEHAQALYNTLLYPNGITANSTEDIRVYPNPASDYLIVEIPEVLLHDAVSVCITDVSGRNVFSDCIGEKRSVIGLRWLKPGIYTVEIRAGSTPFVKRISVNL